MASTWAFCRGGCIVVLTVLFVQIRSVPTQIDQAIKAFQVLNTEWYNCSTGLWGERWYNSAHTVATLADFGNLGLLEANDLDIDGYIHNTFVRAQEYGHEGFINGDYEDEGSWALALIRSYDYIGDKIYLDSAVRLFDNMQGGKAPGGGMYLTEARDYMYELVDELYLSVAASLANRIPQNKSYQDIALSHWEWFQNSGKINDEGLIGSAPYGRLGISAGTQGVILGALAELARSTGEIKYIERAAQIAVAAMKHLSTSSDQIGIFKARVDCEVENTCPGLQHEYGIFIRNLFYLHHILPHTAFHDFILSNARSVWQNDRNGENKFGANWTGPYVDATAASQSGALDVLVAAISVA